MKFTVESKFKPAGDQPKAIESLVSGLKKDLRYQTLLGVTGSGKTFTMAHVIEAMQMPTLVIAPNKTLAAQLYQEYRSFFPKNRVCYFVSYYDYYQPEAYIPVTDTYIGKESMINEEIDRFRHAATSALLTRNDVIVVASVSCIYNLGVPDRYFEGALYLEPGKLMTRTDLIANLVKMGFERNNVSVDRGMFRVRGDVFEVRAASEEIIYKIILDEQRIAQISVIDVVRKVVQNNLPDLVLFPPKHFVTNLPERIQAMKTIRTELKERLTYFNKNKLLLEAERIERRTKYDLEMIGNLGYCHGIENYSRHFSGALPGEPPETLLSYFATAPKGGGEKRQFLTIIDESHIAIPQIRGMFEGDKSRKSTLVEHGWRLPSALDNRPLQFKEFEDRIGAAIFTSATPGNFEYQNSKAVVEQIVRPTGLVDPPIEIRPVFDGKKNRSQVDDVMEEAIKNSKAGGRTLLITLTKKMSEELAEFLTGKGFRARFMHSDTKTMERTNILADFRKNEFDILVGINLLREGLDLPEVTLVAILDADREGFLRSQTSLVQTMGRAARNLAGRVILYADEITASMKAAMDECDRRRTIQLAYNKKHHITPTSITKDVYSLYD
jgi:excinuclease ABC subunit B